MRDPAAERCGLALAQPALDQTGFGLKASEQPRRGALGHHGPNLGAVRPRHVPRVLPGMRISWIGLYHRLRDWLRRELPKRIGEILLLAAERHAGGMDDLR